ncbi:uncharacterized protein EAE98_010942 [Botrytis deweyae]|uniref:Uncharacterized protein n=1 Tax=Botrytis deweyae TaxID=2478750 RepID=A0ABQ7I783_9HELO|nr:uncharacterized protein EAE98_010942 [Botrytis deweyae]KAF7915862.1 hypothetical protein EAE98_010942 [Botrytis deweyae]
MYTMYQTRVGAKSDIGVRSTGKNTHTNNIKDENGGMVDKVTPLNVTEKMRYGADTYRKGFLPSSTSILGENQQGANDAHNRALLRIRIYI